MVDVNYNNLTRGDRTLILSENPGDIEADIL